MSHKQRCFQCLCIGLVTLLVSVLCLEWGGHAHANNSCTIPDPTRYLPHHREGSVPVLPTNPGGLPGSIPGPVAPQLELAPISARPCPEGPFCVPAVRFDYIDKKKTVEAEHGVYCYRMNQGSLQAASVSKIQVQAKLVNVGGMSLTLRANCENTYHCDSTNTGLQLRSRLFFKPGQWTATTTTNVVGAIVVQEQAQETLRLRYDGETILEALQGDQNENTDQEIALQPFYEDWMNEEQFAVEDEGQGTDGESEDLFFS